jgi:hypothetical protein
MNPPLTAKLLRGPAQHAMNPASIVWPTAPRAVAQETRRSRLWAKDKPVVILNWRGQ